MRGHGYIPALDGIRAVAVVAVLCYHGGIGWAAGGFLGVDAFFVLSGFLITGLLLKEWGGTGGIALGSFWARRARRLLPALLLVLAAVALYAGAAAPASQLNQIRDDGLASLGYVANWRFIVNDLSYFEQFAVPSPLRHFWSLAIEEQFYLVWPLIVVGILTWRKGSVRALAAIVAPAAIGSAVLMALLYEPGTDPSRVYYGTDTRAQSLLVGALLAMWFTRHPVVEGRHRRAALHGAALVVAVVLGWVWSSTSEQASWLYQGGFLLLAVLVVVVIASVSQPQSGPLGAVLSLRPIRWIGLISYGLYLWHWPVFVFLSPTRTDLDGDELFALRLAMTFAIATVSYYAVERPIRTGAWRGWRIRVAAPTAAAVVAAALLIVTLEAPGQQVVSANPRPPAPAVRFDLQQHQKPPQRVMLVGDSMANSIAPGLERLAAQDGFEFFNASVPGCGLMSERSEVWVGYWQAGDPDGRCIAWRDRWPRDVALWDPDVVVALFGGHETQDHRIDGQVFHFDAPEGQSLALSELTDLRRSLTSSGARIVFLTSPYSIQAWPHPVDRARSGYNNRWIDRWNDFLRESAAADPLHASIVDLNLLLDPEGTWTEAVNGVEVRAEDRVHVSDAGADLTAQWLIPQILDVSRLRST